MWTILHRMWANTTLSIESFYSLWSMFGPGPEPLGPDWQILLVLIFSVFFVFVSEAKLLRHVGVCRRHIDSCCLDPSSPARVPPEVQTWPPDLSFIILIFIDRHWGPGLVILLICSLINTSESGLKFNQFLCFYTEMCRFSKVRVWLVCSWNKVYTNRKCLFVFVLVDLLLITSCLRTSAPTETNSWKSSSSSSSSPHVSHSIHPNPTSLISGFIVSLRHRNTNISLNRRRRRRRMYCIEASGKSHNETNVIASVWD